MRHELQEVEAQLRNHQEATNAAHLKARRHLSVLPIFMSTLSLVSLKLTNHLSWSA